MANNIIFNSAAAVALGVASAAASGDGVFLVSSDFGHEVLRYDAQTGAFIDTFIPAASSGGLDQPHGILVVDDTVLVASFENDRVIRYDRASGAFLDVFIDGANGLDAPVMLAIGPGGALYVTSQLSDEVHRYNATTGAFIDVFVTAGAGGLDGPSGMEFGPDGRLYVAGRHSAQINAYNGATGAFEETIVDSVDGLTSGNTYGISFTLNGDLYLASANQVFRADVLTGAIVATIGVSSIGLERGPGGDLFAARGGANQLAQIDPSTDMVVTSAFLGAGANAPNLLNFFLYVETTPGDINGDGAVDAADLGILLGMFGAANGPSDLNDDNIVDAADLGILLANFG